MKRNVALKRLNQMFVNFFFVINIIFKDKRVNFNFKTNFMNKKSRNINNMTKKTVRTFMTVFLPCRKRWTVEIATTFY